MVDLLIVSYSNKLCYSRKKTHILSWCEFKVICFSCLFLKSFRVNLQLFKLQLPVAWSYLFIYIFISAVHIISIPSTIFNHVVTDILFFIFSLQISFCSWSANFRNICPILRGVPHPEEKEATEKMNLSKRLCGGTQHVQERIALMRVYVKWANFTTQPHIEFVKLRSFA